MNERLNCGQSVIHTFRDRFDGVGELMERFKEYGGGRAPGGYCGALYAAKILLEKDHPERFTECEASFLAAAGSVRCLEIRSLRKLSCARCVENVKAYIERL